MALVSQNVPLANVLLFPLLFRGEKDDSELRYLLVLAPSDVARVRKFCSPVPSCYLLRKEREGEGEMIDRSLPGARRSNFPPCRLELEVRHA